MSFDTKIGKQEQDQRTYENAAEARRAHLVDSSGNALAVGGGTQYTEGDTDASITGTAIMHESTGDTLRPVNSTFPLPTTITGSVGGVVVTNSLDFTAFDLNASAFSEATSITVDYILDSIELNFSTAESKTITITSGDGTIIYEDTNTNQSVSIGDINTAYDANDNITVAVTQFGSAGTMDCILKTRTASATLVGSPDVNVTNQQTAFGELSFAELTPVVQLQFPYIVNSALIDTKLNNGTAAIDNHRLKLSTGSGANRGAIMASRTPIKYNPGQGGLARFTTIYTTGVANSTQIHGIGSESDGYFFGYNGATFGVLRRTGGNPEFRVLTITTKSTTAENITITLDGDADATVAVTDATATDATTTANEIAAHDFSNLGTGWKTYAVGNTVIFQSYDAASHTGTYSLSGATTAIGTFASSRSGTAATDNWIAQSSWSEDVMDGTGSSGMTLDQTKGNVYQIRYQWLGYGMITFSIENSVTGKIVDVHKIQYSNANTLTSVQNPSLPICMAAVNTSNTSDLSIYSASMGAFIEGRKNGGGARHGANTTSATFTSGVETPVITIRNKNVYQGIENRTLTKLEFAGLSQDSTKTATVKFTYNATLTGASFSDVSTNTSTVEVDTSATAISGGIVAFAQGIAQKDKIVFDLGGDVSLGPGDTITISIIPNAANPDVTAALNWVDDF